ncbi:hypothetical protein B0H17DRAFT_866633, partial [Mycena rosella]
LQERGYLLRQRYQPGWEASWVRSGTSHVYSEDGIRGAQSSIMDATRTSDGAHVMLKISRVDEYPDEVPIAEFFSSTALAADSRNHCVPIYEILRPDLNDIVIMVLPLRYDLQCLKFNTIGEAVECFRQMFE